MPLSELSLPAQNTKKPKLHVKQKSDSYPVLKESTKNIGFIVCVLLIVMAFTI